MSSDSPKPITLYTMPLSTEQASKLKMLLAEQGFEFKEKPYTLYYGVKGKLHVAVYEKGPKVVLQGKGTEEFVTFYLEPQILQEARLGYDEVHNPEMFEPHFGIDESGKGDFFGPLVIAGAYVNREIAHQWMQGGIQDSKKIGSDKKIRDLAEMIKKTPGAVYSVVEIKPLRYNELYKKIGNLNRLLAWGHARVIENLAEIKPDCPRALSDQFANPKLIENSLMKQGKLIKLEQRTKAESDVAVAAASILARERFIDWMENTGKKHQVTLPRGASAQVKKIAKQLSDAQTPEILRQLAKVHFRTASEVAPEHYPPPPETKDFWGA